MKTIHSTKKFQPFLRSRKYRVLFLALNFYLIIGVLALLIAIFYLLANLDQADKIILSSITGFVLFISAVIFYMIGYRLMISEEKEELDERHWHNRKHYWMQKIF